MIVNLAEVKIEDGHPSINILKEIDETEIAELNRSFESLSYYKHIKNLYQITIQNGSELIDFKNNICSSNIKIPIGDTEKIILNSNRLISNYCASISMYIDQVEKVLSKIEHKRMEQFRDTCRYLYDNKLEYRFFVIMRNYIMHYDLPFTLFTENYESRKLLFQKSHLLEFSKWKQVKEDIKKMDDTIDVFPMIFPMNVYLTSLFYDFIYNVADKLLYTYEKVGKFMLKHNVKSPAIVRYESIEDLKNGNMSFYPLDLKNLLEALEDIKSHPKITVKFNEIAPKWLKEN